MAKELHDNVSRVKRFNPVGTTIFVGLRAADALLQFYLIRSGWASDLIARLGAQPVPSALVSSQPGSLSPYYQIISAMTLGGSIKQIVALLSVSEQEMPASSAIMIATFNIAINSLNTIFSLWAATSEAPATTNSPLSPMVWAGAGVYVVCLATEMISELQRWRFKKDPANKGKPYAGGLFSLARHINYGAHTIWRCAYAIAAGGWPWGLAVFSWFFYDFSSRGVPVLDQYLSNRYGEDWKAVKERVPYRLIPGIY